MEGQAKAPDTIQQQKDENSTQNYQKLKRKYKALREEYLKVLDNWEDTQKTLKLLTKERKFLREKLDSFLKSQHFNVSDEVLTSAIMAKNNDIPQGQNPFGIQNNKMSNMSQNQHINQMQQQQKKRSKKESHMSTQSFNAYPTFVTHDGSGKHSQLHQIQGNIQGSMNSHGIQNIVGQNNGGSMQHHSSGMQQMNFQTNRQSLE